MTAKDLQDGDVYKMRNSRHVLVQRGKFQIKTWLPKGVRLHRRYHNDCAGNPSYFYAFQIEHGYGGIALLSGDQLGYIDPTA